MAIALRLGHLWPSSISDTCDPPRCEENTDTQRLELRATAGLVTSCATRPATPLQHNDIVVNQILFKGSMLKD